MFVLESLHNCIICTIGLVNYCIVQKGWLVCMCMYLSRTGLKQSKAVWLHGTPPFVCVCVWGGLNADCISDFVLNILYIRFYISLRSVIYQPYIHLWQQIGLIVDHLYLGGVWQK